MLTHSRWIIGDTKSFLIIFGRLVACSLAAISLATALAAQAGRLSTRFDLLTHFAPLGLFGGAMAALYAAVDGGAPRRTWVAAFGITGGAFWLLLMVPELSRTVTHAPPSASLSTKKFIQFNAWEYNDDGARAAAWLAGQSPDVIILEDARPAITNGLLSRGYLPTRAIADTVIFSRSPRAANAVVVPYFLWPQLPSFARATFGRGAERYSVIGVHLTRPYDSFQMFSERALGSLVARYDPTTLIVAGDFNLTPYSFGLHEIDTEFGLERRDRNLASWPAELSVAGAHVAAPFAIFPIDHIYAGSRWQTVEVALGPNLGSDHYPLVATLALEK